MSLPAAAPETPTGGIPDSQSCEPEGTCAPPVPSETQPSTIETDGPPDPASTLDTILSNESMTQPTTTSDDNVPSETSSLLPTSTYYTPSMSLTSALPSESSTLLAAQHSQSEHNAIIGGVIGAVVALALISTVFIVWYYRRKHRTHVAPSAAFRQSYDQLLPRRPLPPRQSYDDHNDADEPPPVFTPGDYIGPYTDGLDKKGPHAWR